MKFFKVHDFNYENLFKNLNLVIILCKLLLKTGTYFNGRKPLQTLQFAVAQEGVGEILL
jgi:hypothetical protein